MIHLIEALREKLEGQPVALAILAEINEELVGQNDREDAYKRKIDVYKRKIKDLEIGMDMATDELKAYQVLSTHE